MGRKTQMFETTTQNITHHKSSGESLVFTSQTNHIFPFWVAAIQNLSSQVAWCGKRNLQRFQIFWVIIRKIESSSRLSLSSHHHLPTNITHNRNHLTLSVLLGPQVISFGNRTNNFPSNYPLISIKVQFFEWLYQLYPPKKYLDKSIKKIIFSY